MSRVGKLPIAIPQGVTVELGEQAITVTSAKGALTERLTPLVHVSHQEDSLTVAPADETKRARAMWGTVRSRLQNMVAGVTSGYTKRLEIKGVGYRAAVSGNILTLALGYSHDIKVVIPEDIAVKVEKQTTIEISGIDKQKVGQVAAEIRSLRKTEPYKGKGVRYVGEYVRSKEGKKK